MERWGVRFRKSGLGSRRMRTSQKSLDLTTWGNRRFFSPKNILSGIIRGKVDYNEWKNECKWEWGGSKYRWLSQEELCRLLITDRESITGRESMVYSDKRANRIYFFKSKFWGGGKVESICPWKFPFPDSMKQGHLLCFETWIWNLLLVVD